MMSSSEAALGIIRARGVEGPITNAVILGSGMGSVADGLENAVTIPYRELPGFPETTVPGHDGRLVIGTHEGQSIAFLSGRVHFYETGDPTSMASAIETLAKLGVQNLIITCSCGSVSPDLYPGSMAIVTDHINFSGLNPLIGLGGSDIFVNMNDAYDPRLSRRLKLAASAGGVTVHDGVFMWFSGPSFETPAEIRMARMLGADLVGMSLVPEVIISRRLGLRTAGIAIVTNFGAGFSSGNPNHKQTLDMAGSASVALKRLVRGFLKVRDDFSVQSR